MIISVWGLTSLSIPQLINKSFNFKPQFHTATRTMKVLMSTYCHLLLVLQNTGLVDPVPSRSTPVTNK